MNTRFGEYVTSTAFSLTLSRHQVTVLYGVYRERKAYPNPGKQPAGTSTYDINFTYLHALLRRGLIEWRGSEKERHGPYMTRAGELMIELLREAELLPAIDAPMLVKESA